MVGTLARVGRQVSTQVHWLGWVTNTGVASVVKMSTLTESFFFKKMGQSRPLFVYFCYLLDTISIIQIEKSVDGVLGI